MQGNFDPTTSFDKREEVNSTEGNYAAVPNEMLDALMRMDLTSREFKLVLFFWRCLQGWQMKERVIATKDFIAATAIRKDHLSDAVKSLIAKGVIQREPTSQRGSYFYRFNERNFGRTHATKVINIDKKGLRLVQNEVPESGTTKYPDQVPRGTQTRDHEVPNSGTSKTPEPALVAGFRVPKDSIKDNQINLKEEKRDQNKRRDSHPSEDGNGGWTDPELVRSHMSQIFKSMGVPR